MDQSDWIARNHRYTLNDGSTGFAINFAGMHFDQEQLQGLVPSLEKAYGEVQKIEAGEIKNPDENRKVTHFTDRQTYPATPVYRQVEDFAEAVRSGSIKGSTGEKLDSVVINGIGGSALGPQLIQFAVNGPYWNELSDEQRNGYLRIYFTDNTDSAGFKDIMQTVELSRCLIVNTSKSGGTQETKNNMKAFEDAYIAEGLDYTRHFCAVTMLDSELDKIAKSSNWLAVFEMAESIGGRTSETNIVGHVPAALTGVNFRDMLDGACHMDHWTRHQDLLKNPAYFLASMWFVAGNRRGDRNMVIVPYADRLVLLSRYLQQLVMESLGKKLDRDNNVVHQGLNVFGNKGGTDAHAFIQQICDGRDDFFITFIEVLKDAQILPIEGEVCMGDFLHGFQAGLAGAIQKTGRQVIQMTIEKVDEFNLGMIIALYERTVAVYAELININAFHQPGVQAYKLESKGIIQLLKDVEEKLKSVTDFKGNAAELAESLGMKEKELDIAGIVAKFAENAQQRHFDGFTISRQWENDQWVYSIN